ncbi:hypothetical protein GYH30_033370 [Glycine max]|nr:hypothetical protein GYH30_033370 [Glycine max]
MPSQIVNGFCINGRNRLGKAGMDRALAGPIYELNSYSLLI